MKKLSPYEFWKTLFLIVLPYTLVNVGSLAVAEPRPSFWIANACIIAAFLVVFTMLYIFGVERKK